MANIVQDGNGNELQGFGSTRDVTLQGEGAELLLDQLGNNNLSRVEQAGGAFADIDQFGSGDIANVDQNGASTTTVTQQ